MLCRYPYVTGSSVIAIKYKDGALIACDTLGESPAVSGTLLVAANRAMMTKT
jgi:20S proteasome alpha/beta subunit